MIDNEDRNASTNESLIDNEHAPATSLSSTDRKRKRVETTVHDVSNGLGPSLAGLDGTGRANGQSQASIPADSDVVVDEEAEIERRRAKRAQIQAKYAHASHSRMPISHTHDIESAASSPVRSPSTTTSVAEDNQEVQFELVKRQDSHQNVSSTDEPSAADYDPDQDRIDEHEKHREQTIAVMPTINAGDSVAANAGPQEDSEDDEDDMFASPTPVSRAGTAVLNSAADTIRDAKRLDETMLDSWADTEGYYRIIIGELLDNRYAVQSILGKGVFSAVVRCIDQEQGETVAIKVIRNNDVMRKAGLKEIALLEKLMAADPDDRKHIVRLRRTFEHRNHLCLVFESLSLNLREVLKKFGREIGINLKAVRAYAQQMFLALSLLRKCDIMHADLKPDNILVSESRTMLKVCDLGSASDISENAPTPYLASRFYRAPEVILGLRYDTAMDVWAIGCTLYEMYTGKILFPGRTNNQMLRLFMECRGKIPPKLLKKAVFAASHFDDEYNFNSLEIDSVSGEQSVRVLNIVKPTNDLRSRLLPGAGPDDRALVLQFIDFLEKCTDLDPSRRFSPSDALKHPFILRGKVASH